MSIFPPILTVTASEQKAVMDIDPAFADYRAAIAILDASLLNREIQLFNAPFLQNGRISTGEMVEKFTEATAGLGPKDDGKKGKKKGKGKGKTKNEDEGHPSANRSLVDKELEHTDKGTEEDGDDGQELRRWRWRKITEWVRSQRIER